MVRVYEQSIREGGELDFFLDDSPAPLNVIPANRPDKYRLTLSYNAQTERFEVAKYIYAAHKREVCYTYPRIEDALRCGARVERDQTGIETEYEVIQ